MNDTIEITLPISKLFDAISELENIKFRINEEYFQQERILILDENNKWIDVNALIVKEDYIQEIDFSDGSQIKTAQNHRIRYKDKCEFVCNLSIDDDIEKADGSIVKITRKYFTGIKEKVYDIMVDSDTHLYQTANGIVHHNTEVARQIANLLNVKLVKFDMSEFMEKHSVSKLIGAPPGYIGFSDGGAGSGMLINEIEQTPHCVLLLDEVEKAHQDVFNILLQIMDDGKITAANGKTVKFDNVLLIMTTNLGASNMARNPLGFARDSRTGEDTDAVNKFFSPEFRNRLDEVVPFGKLSQELILKIVDKFVGQLNDMLAAKNIVIVTTEAAKQWLAEKGYDDKYGARPLKRIIDKNIKKPLSKKILFGELSGGQVNVGVMNDELVLG